MCEYTREFVDHHMHACVYYIDSQKGGYGVKAAPGKCLELKHVSKHKTICGPLYVCVVVLYRVTEREVGEPRHLLLQTTNLAGPQAEHQGTKTQRFMQKQPKRQVSGKQIQGIKM